MAAPVRVNPPLPAPSNTGVEAVAALPGGIAEPARGLDLALFEQVAARSRARLVRIVRALVRDVDTAETLAQEALLRAYRARESFRHEANPETWLVSIAVNLARDHLRSRRWAFWRNLVRPEETEPAWADHGASPERALGAREELARVFAAVEDLSPQQREVFVLRFVEEMPLEQIAEAMNLTVGTVKVHLHRATRALRARVGKKP